MNDRQRLSVVILTKNAQDKIKNCLESVKWADEIVIVDGLSTDRTLDICRRYTDKIIQSNFEGFGKERNKGAEAATGQWILELDADEVVTEAFRKKVTEILSSPEEFVGYKFRRKNFFLGHFMRFSGWYHYSFHFFRKGFARYEGLLHEKLLLNGKQGIIEEEIEHYPFDSISEFIKRQNRYTSITSGELFEKFANLPTRTIIYNLILKPFKLFWKFFIKKQGFRDGMHGFVFSILFAWVHFLNWAKYWELIKDTERRM